MKVLELTCEPILYGGQEAFIFNCLENIRDSDLDIDVATLYYLDNSKYRSIAEHRRSHIYELNLEFRPGKSRRLIIEPLHDFLLEHKYDIVHVHSGSISALAYSAETAKRSGVKYVLVHSHSTGIDNLKHKIIQNMFASRFLKNTTKYLACSKDAGKMKFPKSVWDEVIILNNGIDTGKFQFSNQVRERIRSDISVPTNAYLVGQIGRFTFEKNQAYMAGVCQEMQTVNRDVFFVFIGDGEQKKSVQEALAGNDRVIFLEAKDDIWSYYNALDLLVLPSLYEGIPLVSIEAQANGLPIIASTGVSEGIEINNNVVRLDLADRNKWVRMIGACDMRRTARINKVINSEWDISSVTENLTNIYRSVLM